jgi:hypothetical protein
VLRRTAFVAPTIKGGRDFNVDARSSFLLVVIWEHLVHLKPSKNNGFMTKVGFVSLLSMRRIMWRGERRRATLRSVRSGEALRPAQKMAPPTVAGGAV